MVTKILFAENLMCDLDSTTINYPISLFKFLAKKKTLSVVDQCNHPNV